jgi:hypothetical protein
MRSASFLLLLILVTAAVYAAVHLWAFILVPAMETVPEGETLVVWRGPPLVDSIDAQCRRQFATVTDFCLSRTYAAVSSQGVVLRLRYIAFLNDFSAR